MITYCLHLLSPAAYRETNRAALEKTRSDKKYRFYHALCNHRIKDVPTILTYQRLSKSYNGANNTGGVSAPIREISFQWRRGGG